MSSQAALAAQAKQCLAKAAPIPGAPLWHMGWGDADDKAVMQNAVDYLTCKAKAKMPFTEDEKHFLVEVFEAFWWGGKILDWIPGMDGMPEAATLANHYVHGDGKTLEVSAELYKTSVIVRDTMAAMKAFIGESINKGIPVPLLRSGDLNFMKSQHFAKVSRGRGRNQQTQGHVLNDGALQAEQQNLRLRFADHRFHLQAYSSVIGNTPTGKTHMHTRWRVDSIWDYEPFRNTTEDAKYISELPMGHSREHKLVLPDGLSQYMTVLGIAKVFNYWAEWHETWDF
ncbi:MAG: hypothetical protein FWD67_03470 [Betaproteobacteria bacterium]|nr:hypothetical protein [Betaproteobacteria bacterium]